MLVLFCFFFFLLLFISFYWIYSVCTDYVASQWVLSEVVVTPVLWMNTFLLQAMWEMSDPQHQVLEVVWSKGRGGVEEMITWLQQRCKAKDVNLKIQLWFLLGKMAQWHLQNLNFFKCFEKVGSYRSHLGVRRHSFIVFASNYLGGEEDNCCYSCFSSALLFIFLALVWLYRGKWSTEPTIFTFLTFHGFFYMKTCNIFKER